MYMMVGTSLLKAGIIKRIAERNSGNQVQYTCTLEQCSMTIDAVGTKHCDKIIN